MPRQKRGTEIMAWRPVRDIDRMFDEIEETFEDVFGRPFYPVAWARTPEIRAWSPPMEIYETDDSYTVRMELPDIVQEDINISATEDSVTISGEREAPEGMAEENYILCERCYGTFERTITFPTVINMDNIKANYENGVLELNVAKVAEAIGKKIEIATGAPQQLRQGRLRSTKQTGTQARAQTRRGSRSSHQRELEEQENLKESGASAEVEKAAFEYEQTGNPAQTGSDVRGELPGQTGAVGEVNRSGRVHVVTPGEKTQRQMPGQRLEPRDTQKAMPDEVPGQAGDTDNEGP